MRERVHNTSKQNVLEAIEAPEFMGIESSDFVIFKLRGREYVRKVQEKGTEQGVQNAPLTTLRNSIIPQIMDLFVEAG